MKQQTADVERRSRREFIGSILQTSGALLLIQNVPVTAESKSFNYKESLIMNTQTVEESITQYIQAWNEKGLKNIKTALEKCWTADGTYTDSNNPPMKGLDKLAAVIQGSQEKMPERKIARTSRVDFHDNSGRYQWLLTKKNGEKSEGLDYFEFNAENRITRVVSFFGVLS
jgi:hypothetical protein